jgi:hypothetical protein
LIVIAVNVKSAADSQRAGVPITPRRIRHLARVIGITQSEIAASTFDPCAAPRWWNRLSSSSSLASQRD